MNEVQALDPSDTQPEANTQPLSWRERMQWEAAQLMANPRETMHAWAQTAGRNTLNVTNTAIHRLTDVSRALLNPPEHPPTLNTPIAERSFLPGEVDMSTAQATVEGYLEVAANLQERQTRLMCNEFESVRRGADSAQVPVALARGFVGFAQETETISAHAGGYLLGLQGEPTLQSVTDAYGRVIQLDELGASMQAQVAQGRLEMQARAALIGRTEAAIAAKLSQLYQEQAGRGVANPIVPDLPHDAAVNIVSGLWTRVMPSIETNLAGGNQTIDAAREYTQDVSSEDVVSQAGSSDSTRNAEIPVSPESPDSPQETGEPTSRSVPENPPQISTATWIETHFSDLGLTLTHEEAVLMALDAEHYRRQYERASAHVNERHEAGDHTPITAIVRGRIDEALTNIPNLADVRLLGESVDAVVHALQNLQNADPQIRARVGTIFLTRIREMQQNMPASNVSAIGDADPSQKFVSAVIAQMEIYSQEESDVNRVHGAIGEIHRLCQEYVVVDESIGLQEGQNHFESTMYITLPLEDTALETNFFVGRHTYLQVGDQIARVATGNDGNNEPIIRLYFDHFQEGRDSSFSLRELVESQSSGTTSPISIDSAHTYSWHIERDGGVATTTDEDGKETTNMKVRIVCDVTESSADGPEGLTELHDSVIRDPSSATNLHGATFADGPSGSVNTNNVDVSPQEAYFGDQPDEPSPEPPSFANRIAINGLDADTAERKSRLLQIQEIEDRAQQEEGQENWYEAIKLYAQAIEAYARLKNERTLSSDVTERIVKLYAKVQELNETIGATPLLERELLLTKDLLVVTGPPFAPQQYSIQHDGGEIEFGVDETKKGFEGITPDNPLPRIWVYQQGVTPDAISFQPNESGDHVQRLFGDCSIDAYSEKHEDGTWRVTIAIFQQPTKEGNSAVEHEEKNVPFQQRLDEIITHVPGPLQQPTRRLYEIAWDELHAELDVVRRVGEVAGDSHIPFLGPAFAGFAEFIQGTFTLRNLETGLITPESRTEAHRHFVNWITSSIEGGVDLAEFVTGGEPAIEVIRSILLDGKGQRELIPRLISSVICQRLVEASRGSGSEIIGTIGQIAAGLLGDNGIASGVDAALLADQRFTGFVDKLKEHLRRSPPLTSRT